MREAGPRVAGGAGRARECVSEAGLWLLPLAWEDGRETGVEYASRFGEGHWPSWRGGERKQNTIWRALQVCAACELPKQRWRPLRVCTPGIGGWGEGQKFGGVFLHEVMVSLAGLTMGGVYPEKEAGPWALGVRMSGRPGPPAEEAEEVCQARAGFAGGGRGPLRAGC